jgi:cellulose synthase/poly-beta-1,6-N-acetylglucosamine synthase-like glycosyltransferase
MIALFIGYQKVPIVKNTLTEEISLKTKFSIIIPFRNEAENLPELLKSIAELKYSFNHFEIIFVDDTSEDHSVKLIEEFFKIHSNIQTDFQIIANQHTSNSPKKDAISLAIKIAKYPWIITTDADCMLPSKWLSTFDAFIQKKEPNMVVGPVSYLKDNSLINSYQQLDNFSLQATTIGCFGLQSPLLSNGANFGYKKEAFIKVNGFDGNDHLASGDDIFLLEKFVNESKSKVAFVKSIEAMVITKAEKTWAEIITQRIRWASKTTKQKSIKTRALGLLVFLVNLIIILAAILCFIDIEYGFYFAVLFVLKIMIDGIIIYKHTSNFSLKFNPLSFLISEILYPFITIIVVFVSLNGRYTWKKRTFNK